MGPRVIGAGIGFPGQGVDPVDTVRVLAEHASDPLVATLAEVTGRRAWAPADMADTRIAQPCVVAAGLLVARSVDPAGVVALLGHSLGEITALAHAGVIAPAAALALCRRRAEIGYAQQAARPGRMLAVMKLDATEVEAVRAEAVARTGGALGVAVVNGPRQLVLSGDLDAVDVALDLAFEHGGKARRLGIGGAYHTPLLAHVVASFTAEVAAVVSGEPSVPVVCSTAGVVRLAAEVPELLGLALVRPVRWPDALDRARALGVDRGIDAGPGATLAGLARHLQTLPFEPLRTLGPLGERR